MAVTVKVEPIARDIEILIDDTLSPEAASRFLADAAEEELAEAQAINKAALGHVPPHETYVDGRSGAPLESVKPTGTILFEFEIFEDMLEWIGTQLIQHSPVWRGTYANSHMLFADGVAHEPGAPLVEADEYVFVNVQPYARKIERGLSRQAPSGVYEAVALLARRRFSNMASIKFTFREPLTGPILEWARGRDLPDLGTKARERQLLKDVRNPAIVVRMR